MASRGPSQGPEPAHQPEGQAAQASSPRVVQSAPAPAAPRPATLSRDQIFAAVKRLDPATASLHPSLQPWPARIGRFVEKVEAREGLVKETIASNAQNYQSNDNERMRLQAVSAVREALNGANELADTYDDRYLIALDNLKRQKREAETKIASYGPANPNTPRLQAFVNELDELIQEGYETLGLSRASWETTAAQLRSKSYEERSIGMSSLAEYPSNQAARHMVEGLHDAHYQVRRAALGAIVEASSNRPGMRSEIGRQAVEYLHDLGPVKDQDLEARRQAVLAAAERGGKEPAAVAELAGKAVQLVSDLGPQREIYRLKSAKITWSEGGREEFPKTYNSFREIESAVRDIASYMKPNQSGYDKTGFELLFEDGTQYLGRIDVHAGDRSAKAPLRDHVMGHLQFYAGHHCPSHMKEDEYRRHLEYMERENPDHIQSAKDLLTHYDWED